MIWWGITYGWSLHASIPRRRNYSNRHEPNFAFVDIDRTTINIIIMGFRLRLLNWKCINFLILHTIYYINYTYLGGPKKIFSRIQLIIFSRVVPVDDLSKLFKFSRFAANNFVNIDFLLIDYKILFVTHCISDDLLFYRFFVLRQFKL